MACRFEVAHPGHGLFQQRLHFVHAAIGCGIQLGVIDETAGVDVALAVRGPVQILPRDLLGFPILAWAILYRRLPARLVDAINAPILRLSSSIA